MLGFVWHPSHFQIETGGKESQLSQNLEEARAQKERLHSQLKDLEEKNKNQSLDTGKLGEGFVL